MNIQSDGYHADGYHAGRYHGLDVLRSFAMLMGIVFHAPQFYYIPEMAYGFRDFGISTDMIPEMDFWLQILVQWSHSWRMTAFFIISGFLALMVFQRKGAALFTGRHSLDKLRRRPVMLAIGAVALASFAIAFIYVDGVFGHRRTASASMSDAVTGSAFAAVSALSWSFLLLGVTHALVRRSNALVRWLVELSYPVYLAHLLPVMVVSAMLIGKGYGQPAVIVGTVILTFLISVIIY